MPAVLLCILSGTTDSVVIVAVYNGNSRAEVLDSVDAGLAGLAVDIDVAGMAQLLASPCKAAAVVAVGCRAEYHIAQSIVTAANYQRIGDAPPETSPLYIRESLTPLVAIENLQSAVTYRFLAQFDVFRRRGADVNITAELFRLSGLLRDEFSTRQSGKSTITLANWSGVSAFVESMPEPSSMRQEDEFFSLPVQVYISMIVDNAAQYTEPTPEVPEQAENGE